jgi:hypothetical protein
MALLLTIALGIGSNVSVRGFARGLKRPEFPYRSLDRVASIFGSEGNRGVGPVSYEQYLLLKQHSDAFEWISAARISPATMVMADQSAIVSLAAVTSNLAGVLELPLGNGAVISHRMWRDEFGSRADVHGEQIRINGIDTCVSGVAPKWLEGLYRDRPIDIWTALQDKGLRGIDDGVGNLWLLARLRRDVSAGQAQSTVRRSRDAFAQMRVLPYTGMTPEMADGMADIGSLLDFATAGVFFIACANVISFLLGRAFARSHETSIRLALGANRSQLTVELLCDSAIISIAGGLCGVLLSVWTDRVVPAFLFEQDAEHLLLAPSLFSIVTASTTCVGITILCGLMPFFLKPDSRPAAVLRRESTGPSKAMKRLRGGLAVTQMTSCCVLVMFTAFLLDGLRSTLQTSAGHRLKDAILITAQAQPYIENSYFEHVEAITRSIGVLPIAWAARLSGSQPVWRSFRIDTQQLSYREILMDISWFTAESLLRFARLPTAGRLFGFGDQKCRVAVVNEQAASKLFGRNTVGRLIQDPTGLPVEIIGVVAEKAKRGQRVSRPTIYYNAADQAGPGPDRNALARFRAPTGSELARADLDTNVVSPNYFEEMGFSLISGPGFTARQMPGECRVAVINQEAADLYFGSKAVVGSAVIDAQGIRTTIVGVVHSRPIGTFQRRSEPAIYFPMLQDCLRRMTLIAVGGELKRPILPDLQRTVESVPGRRPASSVVIDRLSSHLARTALAPLRIAILLFGASATTGILLSILGLFGVLSDAARHRRREVAIRTALGAQPWRIVFQVLQEGGRLACAGALAGTVGALLLSRLLVRIIHGDHSPGLLAWLAAPLILATIVLIAGLLPARRAMITNPLSIMRDE